MSHKLKHLFVSVEVEKQAIPHMPCCWEWSYLSQLITVVMKVCQKQVLVSMRGSRLQMAASLAHCEVFRAFSVVGMRRSRRAG